MDLVERRSGSPEPLAALDEIAARSPAAAEGPEGAGHGLTPDDIPSWIGHISYDAAQGTAARMRSSPTPGAPCMRFARYDALYVFDHERDACFLVGDSRQSCQALEERLAENEHGPLDSKELAFQVGPVTAGDPTRHAENVRSALASIVAGDVYEVNLARRYQAPFHGNPLGLFLRMREQSPVPFGYFVQGEQHAVLGRSMERFLRLRARDGALWTSPIKGTIARAGDRDAEAEFLRTNPKEHAEHSMVVDLMRNDLSRVSRPGSVRIRELMHVLPFAGLSHLVSTVEAQVRSELTMRQVLEGTFPPGSVTGAPKGSAMRIIDTLEESARGIYTGALGFIDRAGGLSLAVAIRTAVVHDDSVTYFAGGGIVAASDPVAETQETDLKAQVFLRAIEAAGPARE